jgi:hypothetical protein
MAFQDQVKLFTNIFKNNFEMIFLHVIYPFLEWISTSFSYHAFPLAVKKGKSDLERRTQNSVLPQPLFYLTTPSVFSSIAFLVVSFLRQLGHRS